MVWRLASFTTVRNRDFRSTSVAIWLLFEPITRSPSRCPDLLRSSAAWGRSSIGRASVICERYCPFTVWCLFFRIGRPVRRRLHSSRGITFHRVV